jgi:hypothetical protein
MKKTNWYLLCSFLFLCACVAFGDGTPLPSPTPSLAPVGTINPILGSIYGKVFLGVFALNAILSALRDIVAKYDGVNPGDQAPAGDTSLNLLQKACGIVGKILDFIQGNVQH